MFLCAMCIPQISILIGLKLLKKNSCIFVHNILPLLASVEINHKLIVN